MGFGLNPAFMAGLNQGLTDAQDREYTLNQRARADRMSNLNEQVLGGQVEDLNRARTNDASLRTAAAGAYGADEAIRKSNDAVMAARGDPALGIGTTNQSLDSYDAPKLKAEGGRMATYKAMRGAAEKIGDMKSMQALDTTMTALKKDGMVQLAQFLMSHGKEIMPGSPESMEASKIYNSYGEHRVAPGAFSMDAAGNFSGISPEGKRSPTYNMAKLAAFVGLVKPDEYASAGEGRVFNKRTGELKGDAKKDHPLNSNFSHRKNEDGSDSIIDLRTGKTIGEVDSSGAEFPVPPPKIRDKISQLVDAGYRGAMGELTGTTEARDRQKVLGEQIWAVNKDLGFTEAQSVEAARALQGGKVQIGTFNLEGGSTTRGFQFNGQPVFITQPKAAAPAALAPSPKVVSAPKAAPAPAPVPKPTVGIGAKSPQAASAPVGMYREIPPPPTHGKPAEFNAWEKQFGDQYQINQGIEEQRRAEALAEKDRQFKGGSLKSRLQQSKGQLGAMQSNAAISIGDEV